MYEADRDAILNLFARLREVESRSGPREPEAAALIDAAVAAQPAAPYHMAQTIIVQNQALRDAERRIEELESARAQPGLFSALLGSAGRSRPGGRPPKDKRAFAAQGNGFLAGAAETALGVGGGMLLADFLVDAMIGADEAAAEDADAATGPEAVNDSGFGDLGPGGDL